MNLFRRNFFCKRLVMLDKEHGSAARQEQLFYLHTGKYVDKIERLIPNIQVRSLSEAFREQHFFLLAAAVCLHILLKLYA